MSNLDYKIKKYNMKLQINPQQKYLKKLSEYVLTKYLSQNQNGGAIPIEYYGNNVEKSLAGVIKFINESFKNKNKFHTKKPYIMIVMGATGSGKTEARTVGYNVVKNLEKSDEKIDTIKNSFIDISVDEYVNGTTIVNDQGIETTGENILKTTMDKYLADKQINIEAINMNYKENMPTIKELSNISYQTYSTIRNMIDQLPMVMLYLALHLKINVIFETTSGEWLIDFIIKNLNYYCIPIVIYPVVSVDNLVKRTINRGAADGRVVNPGLLENGVKSANAMFTKIIELKNDPVVKDLVAIKYDNDNDMTRGIIQSDKMDKLSIIDSIHKYQELETVNVTKTKSYSF
jgi:hypothetical protein